jgi:trans-aconitate methyltransferase
LPLFRKILSSGMNKSEQAIAVFDKRAIDYQSRYMDVSGYHDTLDVFCDLITPNAGILELACGPGNVTRYLLDKRNDLQITATDLAPNMIALAKANNPEAKCIVMDMRDTSGISGKYDGIVCGFGLPYLSKDETLLFIESLPNILNPDAVIYMSTMEGDYNTSSLQKSSDGKDEIFIHYHQADYLVEALEKVGFTIVLKRNQIFPASPNTTDLILIAQWFQKS